MLRGGEQINLVVTAGHHYDVNVLTKSYRRFGSRAPIQGLIYTNNYLRRLYGGKVTHVCILIHRWLRVRSSVRKFDSIYADYVNPKHCSYY